MATPVRPPAAPAADHDWPRQIAGTVESVVGTIRDRTTVPVQTVARALVFGTIVAVMGIVALVLVCIALVRGITLLVDDVWITYLILGGLFTPLGAFLLFVKAKPAAEKG